MNAALDFWNIMSVYIPAPRALPYLLSDAIHRAYDYAGSWSSVVRPSGRIKLGSCSLNRPLQADNQANLYGPAPSGFDTDSAVKFYLSHGATAGKINVGIPLYGRAFEKTAGYRQPYDGVRHLSAHARSVHR